MSASLTIGTPPARSDLHRSLSVVPRPTMVALHCSGSSTLTVAWTTAVMSVRLSAEAREEKAEEDDWRSENGRHVWNGWDERNQLKKSRQVEDRFRFNVRSNGWGLPKERERYRGSARGRRQGEEERGKVVSGGLFGEGNAQGVPDRQLGCRHWWCHF